MFEFYIPIVVVIFFLYFFCWTFRLGRTQTVTAVATMLGQEPSPQPPEVLGQAQAQELAKGLDQATIDSYPRVVIGESMQMLEQDDKTCPICLIEYNTNDTLMIVPECLHRFHVDCLDQWLRCNPSCPICRIQPHPL